MMTCKKWTVVFGIVASIAATSYGEWTWETVDYPGAANTQLLGIDNYKYILSNNNSLYSYPNGRWSSTPWSMYEGMRYQDFSYTVIGGDYLGGYCTVYPYEGESYIMAFVDKDMEGLWDAGDEVIAIGSDGKFIYNYGVNTFINDGTTSTILPNYNGRSSSIQYSGLDGDRIVGAYTVADGTTYGFIYDGTNWTELGYPGAQFTYIDGISGNNIVGFYTDDTGYHNFLFDGSQWTSFDYPGASHMVITGINGDTIVGWYTLDGHTHGLVLTIPEPASLSLLAIGGLLVARRKR